MRGGEAAPTRPLPMLQRILPRAEMPFKCARNTILYPEGPLYNATIDPSVAVTAAGTYAAQVCGFGVETKGSSIDFLARLIKANYSTGGVSVTENYGSMRQ